MLARLQSFITLSLLAAGALWVGLCLQAGQLGWALWGAAALLTGHAAFLALEFALMAWSNVGDTAPRAKLAQVATAWWGEALSAPLVFCFRQPFRSRSWPDHLSAKTPGQPGVLLVHGFFCNRGIWNPWLQRLCADGTPFSAVNLEPVFGSIDDYAGTIEKAVRALERATGKPPVIVAHSMGGLVVRQWCAEPGNLARIRHVVTLGTPHQGTVLARWAFSPNGRQMRRDSRWLSTLRGREAEHAPQWAARFTCFYSHCDNIVFPASKATLEGADNRHLAGVAHVHMCTREEPYSELRRLLADASDDR